MDVSGLSIIAGVPAAGGTKTFHAANPATGEELEPQILTATPDEIEQAVSAASEAFDVFGRTSGDQRALLLRTIAEEVENLLPELRERMPQETALPVGRVEGEAARTCGQLRLFADLVEEGSWVDARIDRAQPDRQPLPKPDIRSMYRPLGPVAVFGASNFPLAFSVAGGDTASALAAGNPVIAVAHYAHPGTAEIVGWAITQAVRACDLPAGVFSLLQGRGEDIAPTLIRHPALRAVALTGSRTAGTALTELATERDEPIPVFAEMSSVNPVFLLPDALEHNADAIAEGLVGSVTLGVGQFCTNPGFVFIPAGALGTQFADRVATLGSNASAAPMLTAAHRENYAGALAKMADRTETVVRAEDSKGPGGQAVGLSVLRTSVQDLLSGRVDRDEIFGPCTVLVEYDDVRQLVEVVKTWDGQLTATLHASAADLEGCGDLVAALEDRAGRILFGGFPTGVEVCASMVHGGPFPATSDGRTTSVGTRSIYRFARLVCYQNAPTDFLPEELRDANPRRVRRLEDNQFVDPKA